MSVPQGAACKPNVGGRFVNAVLFIYLFIYYYDYYYYYYYYYYKIGAMGAISNTTADAYNYCHGYKVPIIAKSKTVFSPEMAGHHFVTRLLPGYSGNNPCIRPLGARISDD